MAESKNDDLADALARLAGGDVAPSEQEPPTPPAAPPAAAQPLPAAKAVRPATARHPAAKPPAAAPQPAPRPAAPAAPRRPANPAPVPASPAAPVSPVTAVTPVVRRQRPSAPVRQVTVAPTDAEADGGQSTGLSREAEGQDAIVDDDDSVIMPAPEASVFMPKKKPTTSAEARAAIQRKKSLEYRRTLIPILLTSGTLMLIFGVLKFFTGSDSTLQYIPTWITITLIFGAVVLLALAGANIMSVKAQLAADEKPTTV